MISDLVQYELYHIIHSVHAQKKVKIEKNQSFFMLLIHTLSRRVSLLMGEKWKPVTM